MKTVGLPPLYYWQAREDGKDANTVHVIQNRIELSVIREVQNWCRRMERGKRILLRNVVVFMRLSFSCNSRYCPSLCPAFQGPLSIPGTKIQVKAQGGWSGGFCEWEGPRASSLETCLKEKKQGKKSEVSALGEGLLFAIPTPGPEG